MDAPLAKEPRRSLALEAIGASESGRPGRHPSSPVVRTAARWSFDTPRAGLTVLPGGNAWHGSMTLT
ncbi:MAG: hypothetical protein NVS2B9_02160 [Myxococcales bacterium]